MRLLLSRISLAVCVVSAALAVTACDPKSSAAGPDDGGGTAPTGTQASATTKARTTTPAPTTTTKTTESSTGTLDPRHASGQITEMVDCDSISSDISMTARDGRTHWTAVARRGEKPTDQAAAGVQTSPSSGDLNEGQRTVVHVSGTLDPNSSFSKHGKFFYVHLSWPNRGGSGSVALEFQCR